MLSKLKYPVLLVVFFLGFSQAQAVSSGEVYRRNIQFDIHIAMFFSGITIFPSANDGYFQLGGGYGTLTLIDRWQLEIGGSAIGFPSGTGGEFVIRSGASFPIYRANEKLGFELRIPTFVGFSGVFLSSEDEGHKSSSSQYLLRLESGLQFTYWYRKVGVFFRALGGLVIDPRDGAAGFSGVATFGVSL